MSAGSVNNVLLANIASLAGIAKSNIASIAGSTVVGGIITDGLVLYVDAGNTDSYPGSGTTWTDISTNSNNGTLTNGPTFDSGDGGSIVFDGTDDYVDFGNILNIGTGDASFTGWAKRTGGDGEQEWIFSKAYAGDQVLGDIGLTLITILR